MEAKPAGFVEIIEIKALKREKRGASVSFDEMG